MSTPRRMAVAGAGALLLAVVFGAVSTSNEARKEATRYSRQQLLELKKQAVYEKAVAGAAAATAGSRARVAGRDEQEPNNLARQATPLISRMQESIGATVESNGSSDGGAAACVDSVSVHGTIDAVGDVDYWSVEAKAGEVLKVSLDSDKLGAPTDLTVTVTGPVDPNNPDDCGAQILGFRDDGYGFSGVTTDPCTFVEVAADGIYLIEVASLVPGGGPDHTYRLTVEVPLNLEQEPNDDPLAANPVEIGLAECVGAFVCGAQGGVSGASNNPGQFTSLLAANVGATRVESAASSDQTQSDGGGVVSSSTCVSGVISAMGDRDCYAVELGAGQVLQASVDGFKCANFACGSLLDPVLELYDSLAQKVAEDDDTDDLDPGLLFTAPAAGTYSVCVRDHFDMGGDCWRYQLSLSLAGCRDEGEGNDACGGATLIRCPSREVVEDDDTCIRTLTLENTRTGTVVAFPRDDTWGSNTTYTIDGDSGTFHVSCSQCLQVGQTSGRLRIVAIDDPSGRVAEKCNAVCISSITLRNTRTSHTSTFYRDETWGSNTTYTIDGDRGTFHVSCSQCLRPGDTNGRLTIVSIVDPSGRLAERCGN